jgi:hypothetical protein
VLEDRQQIRVFEEARLGERRGERQRDVVPARPAVGQVPFARDVSLEQR